MEELSYALITMLGALRLEIRAASLRQMPAEIVKVDVLGKLRDVGSVISELETASDRLATEALVAGQAPLNRKEA